jgi:peptidoglycan/LPS O-acetylase OafA/YrhL
MPFIDVLKAFASQLIVLHHLAIYGPLSRALSELAPGLVGWLFQYGRLAVPVFLATAGFLSARGLAPGGIPQRIQPLNMIAKRYMRLAVPYLAALLCALLSAAIARTWMQDEATPLLPGVVQLISHVFLLQDVLGYTALSAGAWYVAIDFQLYVLMVGLLWFAQQGNGNAYRSQRALLLITAAATLSLLYFNLEPNWDVWGVYFFGSYALGALAYWAAVQRRATLWIAVLAMAGVGVLVFDFRTRIAVALITAIALALSTRFNLFERVSKDGVTAYLARISYSTFLIHYAVSLLVNTLFAKVSADQPALTVAGFVFAWGASVAAGAMLYRYVEAGPVFFTARRALTA